MKKRILSLIIILSMVFGCLPTFAMQSEETVEVDSSAFITVYIPFESDYIWDRVFKARYTDTKEIIPFSQAYDGRMYAIIPAENADREIEAFETQEVKFSDHDSLLYEFHVIEQLSRIGVIIGDEDGKARPFDNITRAEAATMLMRLIGLENTSSNAYKEPFDDVSEDDWYYDVVVSAYNYGIIQGDSETIFSPERNVTREEITVMSARAIQYVGLGYPGDDNMNATDIDKVSDWAKEAYSMLGSYAATDYDDSDPKNPVRVINPQNYATRYDVADTLYNICRHCCVYPSKAAEQFGFDKGMPIIDGSTSTYPFTTAVYSSLFYNGMNHPSMPRQHSKSHATYQKLINGEIDVMFASVYPASDILEMAEQKGVELELIPIAYDAMIFFTNKDNSIVGLTSEQISDIYVNNAYENWNELGGPDALLYPYCRNNDSGSHAQMEKHFLNGNEIHENIRSESTSIAMASVLTDVIQSKTESPVGFGLGYSIYYYYHNMDMVLGTKQHLKLLSVDGVHPNDDTIADGSYPLSNNTYIVVRKDTPNDAPARRLAEFMLTEQGQNCVESAGFGKLKPSTDNLTFADKLGCQMPTGSNYMFSPLSVKMALALAANGAEGETKSQILNALNEENVQQINVLSKELIEKYSQTDNLKFDIANSIWINSSRTNQGFCSDFKDVSTEYYSADVMTVSEKNAVEKINSWVSRKTNNKINGIVDDSDFDALLVNALYFKGNWESEFNNQVTGSDGFTSADGTVNQIDFMNKTSWLNCASTADAQIVELPYKTRFDNMSESGEYLGSENYDIDVSMYLMMSDRSISVEQTLNEAIDNEYFGSSYVSLSVPKFEIEFSTSLNDVLKNIGITSAFDSSSAQFQKMFDNGNMWFSDTVHKTYIKIDEKGTEAAALTSLAMGGSAMPPEPIEIKFNKPFYFVIRDNTSGEILFMGRYAYAE